MLPNLNPFKLDNPSLLSIDKSLPSSLPSGGHIEAAQRFNPYVDNGGNVVGISFFKSFLLLTHH